VTNDWTLIHYTPQARTKLFALWAADLAAGETLICRSIKAATIGKYLADAGKFIAGFTGEDPRFKSRSDPQLHPLIKGVLAEVTRFEHIPNKREPHTPAMQQWLHHEALQRPPDDLGAAMADWGAVGLVLGPRISEWGQEDGTPDPLLPKRAPSGSTYAFTWNDVEVRLLGNTRTATLPALTADILTVESVTVTFTWQKNGNHGEKKLLVRNDSTPALCPVRNFVRILARFHRLMGINPPLDTPLAIYAGPLGRPTSITASNVANFLRQAASAVYDINPATPVGRTDLLRWSSHSLRVGACVILHVNGFSSSEIQFLLRWKSDAFMQYLRNLGTLSRKQNAALSTTDGFMPNLL
jgi:hypothetical protein